MGKACAKLACHGGEGASAGAGAVECGVTAKGGKAYETGAGTIEGAIKGPVDGKGGTSGPESLSCRIGGGMTSGLGRGGNNSTVGVKSRCVSICTGSRGAISSFIS